ncbi:MAG: PIN domain-containing protein [Caldilineales bacterium]|nr:PIN domain-containing protein [Caldilineales bacterium]
MLLDRIFRFLGLIVFAIIGWQIGIIIAQTNNPFAELSSFRYIGPLTIAGAILGWLVAPWLTTRPALWAIRFIRQIPIEEVVAGAIGLALGLAVAALLVIPLSRLPNPFGSILPFIASIIFGYLGAVIAVLRGPDLMAMFSRSRRATERSPQTAAAPRSFLLDTSVIIDGRIGDVARTGFLPGPLLVPRFILAELQYIADSPDPLRRARGRRGLEVLETLRELPDARLEIVDLDVPGVRDVDEKLVALARQHRFGLITNDFNLNRVAVLQGVKVLNLNDLANAMKAIYLPGEHLRLRVIQEGKEVDQGVGFLEDGTMVVVENGSRYIGKDVDLTVTKVLQTSAGRMIFATPSSTQ